MSVGIVYIKLKLICASGGGLHKSKIDSQFAAYIYSSGDSVHQTEIDSKCAVCWSFGHML